MNFALIVINNNYTMLCVFQSILYDLCACLAGVPDEIWGLPLTFQSSGILVFGDPKKPAPIAQADLSSIADLLAEVQKLYDRLPLTVSISVSPIS